jgi:hypothetical protein
LVFRGTKKISDSEYFVNMKVEKVSSPLNVYKSIMDKINTDPRLASCKYVLDTLYAWRKQIMLACGFLAIPWVIDGLSWFSDKLFGLFSVKGATIISLDKRYNDNSCHTTFNYASGSLVSQRDKGIFPEPESFGHGDKMAKKRPDKMKSLSSLRSSQVNPQGGDDLDLSGNDLLRAIVNRNVYQLWIQREIGSDVYMNAGYITMVYGRIGIIPRHFFADIEDRIVENAAFRGCTVSIRKTEDMNSHGYKLTVQNLIDGTREGGILPEYDMILVELPSRHFQVCVDRRDCFINDADLDKMDKFCNFAMVFTKGTVETLIGSAQIVKQPLNMDSVSTGRYQIPRYFEYKGHTTGGCCGTPFFYLNSALGKRKIAGFHIAGAAGGLSFSTIITREMLENDLKLFDKQVVELDVEEAIPQMGNGSEFKNFNYIGTIKKVPSKNFKTSITPSRLYGKLLPIFTRPARLRDSEWDKIYPMKNAASKYCLTKVLISPIIEAKMAKQLYRQSDNYRKFILSVQEVLDGLDYDISRGGLPGQTSAGYPMNVPGEENLKKRYFQSIPGTAERAEALYEIEKMVNDYVYLISQGVRPVVIFTDFLKDERREIEKYTLGKTRLVSGSPFKYTVAFIQYFGAFSRSYMAERIQNGSGIGVNPYSTEWDVIARKLGMKAGTNRRFFKFKMNLDTYVGAGDYSGYDGKEIPALHYMILDHVNLWYGDDNVAKRLILWLELVNSKHLINHELWEWCSSLPSGHPFTIIINTLYNHLAFIYCFIRATEHLHLTGSFYDFVYLIAVGDDNVFSVDPCIAEVFNEMTLPMYMSEIGLVYTTELKVDALVPSRPLSSIEFLKRGFRYEDRLGIYLAPLRLSVIMEMCCWTKIGSESDNIALSNCETAIRELSLHPVDVFDLYAKSICDVFKTCYPHLGFKDFSQLDYFDIQDEVINLDYKYC